MTTIDARVRLPKDRRGGPYTAPARQTEQYDKVLDAAGIERAVIRHLGD